MATLRFLGCNPSLRTACKGSLSLGMPLFSRRASTGNFCFPQFGRSTASLQIQATAYLALAGRGALLRAQHSSVLQGAPCCFFSNTSFNVPPSADFLAGPAGVCTMFKLPTQATAEGLDAAFVGVPLDTGTSNRPGARFGPRHIRAESALVRRCNPSTGADPYNSLMVADIGDVNVNLYNLKDSCRQIREAFQRIIAEGCTPLTLGGDHTITYPILQAIAEKHGPVGLVHVDAHTDTGDQALGEKIYHGTPFRRCVEEGLLDCKRVIQIGIRGSSYVPDPYKYSRDQGFRVVLAEDCWLKSLVPLMAEVRKQMGEKPVYISFDIDGIDPAYAPGTGTPEIAGLTPAQALEIIRGCQGLNIVGGDLVEVAPMYDASVSWPYYMNEAHVCIDASTSYTNFSLKH